MIMNVLSGSPRVCTENETNVNDLRQGGYAVVCTPRALLDVSHLILWVQRAHQRVKGMVKQVTWETFLYCRTGVDDETSGSRTTAQRDAFRCLPIEAPPNTACSVVMTTTRQHSTTLSPHNRLRQLSL